MSPHKAGKASSTASQFGTSADALGGAMGSQAQVEAMEAAATTAATQQMEMSLLQAKLEVGKTGASLVSTAAQKS